MKFNLLLLLLTISGLVSAIPISENVKPHHGCKGLDCRVGPSKVNNFDPKIPNSLPGTKKINPLKRYKCKIPFKKEPQTPQLIEPSINSFEPTKDNVKIIGRAKYMDDHLWVGLTDSGIEFKINGKSVTIVVSTDSIYGSSKEDTYAELYIYGDDKLVHDVFTDEETKEFTVEFDEEGEHTVRLLKVTECRYGSIYIDEIKTDSKVITPTPSKDKKIEFIGDSITCAVGALEKEGHSLSTSANGINSYAYLVAQKFNADYSLFSFGGYSVYGSSVGLIPDIYEKLGVLDWNIEHPEETIVAMSSVDWDASEFEPDLIVVNLGTNDKFYINGLSEEVREEEEIKFTKAYKEFLVQIRSVHPNAEILCTLGMMGQYLYDQIEIAVSEYVKESNDNKINVFPLSEENIELNGPGYSGHPGINSHIYAANEMISEIEKLYGWTVDPNVDITKNKVNVPESHPNEPEPQPNETVINSFEPTKENVKFIGRAKYIDDHLWFGQIDSGIEFKINGKRATIAVSTDSIYGSLNEDTPAHVLVYGDDELVLDILTNKETMNLDVEFDEEGEHIVRLLKISEGLHGSIYIDEIKSDSKVITPTPPKDKKIEFIGDSITCAFGSIEEVGQYTTTNADGTKSFAYKVAQKLDADYSIYCFGGYSVYKSFVGLVPPLYEKFGALHWNEEHPEETSLAMSSVAWDPTEFEPDLVVVNLGTNDGIYINSVDENLREEELINFTKAYKDFIAQIRSVHPNARILCTVGMLGQFLYEQIENAVNEYVKETNDNKVNAFPLSEQDLEKDGPGFHGHPSILAQVTAANETLEEIEKLYGWTADPNVDISEKKN